MCVCVCKTSVRVNGDKVQLTWLHSQLTACTLLVWFVSEAFHFTILLFWGQKNNLTVFISRGWNSESRDSPHKPVETSLIL